MWFFRYLLPANIVTDNGNDFSNICYQPKIFQFWHFLIWSLLLMYPAFANSLYLNFKSGSTYSYDFWNVNSSINGMLIIAKASGIKLWSIQMISYPSIWRCVVISSQTSVGMSCCPCTWKLADICKYAMCHICKYFLAPKAVKYLILLLVHCFFYWYIPLLLNKGEHWRLHSFPI